jgi:hypothetical protein
VSEPGDLGAPESPRLLSLAVSSAQTDAAGLMAESDWPLSLIAGLLAASADSRPTLEL